MKKQFKSIKEAREYRNLTQKSVADAAEISESYYSLIENGKRRVPITTAAKIADILKISLTEFFLLYDFAKCKNEAI